MNNIYCPAVTSFFGSYLMGDGVGLLHLLALPLGVNTPGDPIRSDVVVLPAPAIGNALGFSCHGQYLA